MYTFKPSRKTAVILCIIVIALEIAAAIYLKMLLGDEMLLPIVLAAIAVFLFFAVFLNGYNRHTRITFSSDEITKYTFFFYYKYQCMSINSVTSVTTFVTPFSSITGLNVLIVNALGARMFLLFLDKEDCKKASEFLESIISSREKD